MYMVGSLGSLVAQGESLARVSICSLADPWYPIGVPEAVMVTGFSGIG
jgi:hypothetical protein